MIDLVLCPLRVMVAASGKSGDALNDLRANNFLPEGIYWFRDPSSGRILWNRNLVLDWIVNGNSPAHQRAIEAFLSSLPSNQAAKKTA
jgi:hypothetical protein